MYAVVYSKLYYCCSERSSTDDINELEVRPDTAIQYENVNALETANDEYLRTTDVEREQSQEGYQDLNVDGEPVQQTLYDTIDPPVLSTPHPADNNT